jgi:hypothetical protein
MPRALSEIYLEDATIDGVPYPSQGGHPISLTYLNEALSPFSPLLSGWAPAIETWEYASATTITVPSGAGGRYQKGDKIRLKQGGGYKYFYIVSVSDTTLSITGGSDYTLANAAITDNYYSKAMNPQGWPVSLGQRVGDKEIWHEGNVGKLLWSGSWSSGSITIPDIDKYSIFIVRTHEFSSPFLGFRRISGTPLVCVQIVGSATNIITRSIWIDISGTTLTLAGARSLQHNESSSHGAITGGMTIATIHGII